MKKTINSTKEHKVSYPYTHKEHNLPQAGKCYNVWTFII